VKGEKASLAGGQKKREKSSGKDRGGHGRRMGGGEGLSVRKRANGEVHTRKNRRGVFHSKRTRNSLTASETVSSRLGWRGDVVVSVGKKGRRGRRVFGRS